MGLSLGQEPVSEPRGKHSPCVHGACFGDRQHTDSCGLNSVSGGDRCCGGTEAGWRPGGPWAGVCGMGAGGVLQCQVVWKEFLSKDAIWTSLVARRLRLCTWTARSAASVPSPGSEISHAAGCGQTRQNKQTNI